MQIEEVSLISKGLLPGQYVLQAERTVSENQASDRTSLQLARMHYQLPMTNCKATVGKFPTVWGY